MANKQLFNTRTARVKPTNTINRAGGAAYNTSAEHALCQYAVTSMFGNTYYAGGKEQLDEVKKLLPQVRPEVIAKVAVYSREHGRMKDMPALLLTYLASTGETELVKSIFHRVCNNVKMLGNVMQMIRANTFGRRSLGTVLKKLFQEWFHRRNGKQLFIASIGHKDPSLADIMRLCHVKPKTPEQVALFSYLLDLPFGRTINGRHTGYYDNLPEIVRQYEEFKKNPEGAVPDVPFTCLTNLALTVEQWREKGRSLPWNTLRMNLNNLARREVFNRSDFTSYVVNKLRDPEEVRKYNAFPYELMQAVRHSQGNVPMSVTNALQDALEVALGNVPELPGTTLIAIDTSGSMGAAVNGGGSVSCREVAALFASALVKANPDSTKVLWFNSAGGWGYYRGSHTGVGELDLNPRDSLKTNIQRVLNAPSGGTDLSLPIRWANENSFKADNVICLSDNESWRGPSRGMATQWSYFKQKNKKAKLVLMDLAPNWHTQVTDARDVLNVGGFNDSVFNVVEQFLNGGGSSDHFIRYVEDNVKL